MTRWSGEMGQLCLRCGASSNDGELQHAKDCPNWKPTEEESNGEDVESEAELDEETTPTPATTTEEFPRK